MGKKSQEKTVRNVKIRKLRLQDIREGTGFFETLESMTPSPVLVPRLAKRAFKANVAMGKVTWVAVEKSAGQIVGTVSFFPEYKYSRGGAAAGHVEDVVTRRGYEGLHIATRLMKCAMSRARKVGCYKLILDCSMKNEEFYKGLGFYKHEIMMRHDFV